MIFMNDYQYAYERYTAACERYDIEPINFHYFLLQLSVDQMHAFLAQEGCEEIAYT